MNDRPRAPELHPDFAWLNTDREVSFAYCNEGQGVCIPANPSWRVPVTFERNGEASAELVAAVS